MRQRNLQPDDRDLFLYFLNLIYLLYLNLRQYGVHSSSRTQPKRVRCFPNFFAIAGGSQACTSSNPRASASRRVASCNPSSHCHFSRGEPDSGSSSRYASAVSRSRAAPAIPFPLSSLPRTSFVRKSGFAKSGNAYPNPCRAWIARSASRSRSSYARIFILRITGY